MAKVFYLGGGTHARGMLRAVVTVEQLNSLVPLDAVSYLGTAFPELESEATVVHVSVSESATESALSWATGFSHIHIAPAEFDERLKFLPQPEEAQTKMPEQKRRNGSGLLHWLRVRSCE